MTDFAPGWGTSAPSLAAALHSLTGHHHDGGSVDPTVFSRLLARCPFMAQLNRESGDHWVIVDGLHRELVRIRDPWGMPAEDPSRGLEGLMEQEWFDEYWKGSIHQVVLRRR